MTYSHLMTGATKAALEAGELLIEGFGSTFSVRHKSGSHNLVTEYDLAAQKNIIANVHSLFPDHSIFAEEEDQQTETHQGTVWIIDPLDGTINFAHGIPFFSVSIAVAVDGEIVCGVIYNPLLNELFTTEKDKGAFLNGKQLKVTEHTELTEGLFATGFPYHAHENPLHCIDRFSEMMRKGMPIRRLGVASLDLAYVAMGRFDAFWEVSLEPWDFAAGKLLIEEAGGKVSHYDGSDLPLFRRGPLLATNSHLHDAFLAMLKEDLE